MIFARELSDCNWEDFMTSDMNLDPPISHAIADGWASFSKTVLPAIGGNNDA
jgi:hypothetical protein